jgi:hypothetical protein
MKVVTIKSSEWHRGRGAPGKERVGSIPVHSALLTRAGTMCCLGICAVHTHNIPKQLVQTAATPAELGSLVRHHPTAAIEMLTRSDWDEYFKSWDGSESYKASNNTSKAMMINDSVRWADLTIANWPPHIRELVNECQMSEYDEITDNERIAMLRPIFRNAGYIIRWFPNA